MNEVYDAGFWDQMYRDRHTAWDAEPNPFLAADIDGLVPGTALDVGCGEGSDSVWLAERGWHVTAVDISAVALDRGRAADTKHRVDWVEADVLTWQPPTEAFDLVSTHFLHIPPADRAGVFGRLAQAVRPGGTLLVVSHHVSDLETTVGRWPMPELYYEAEDIAALLSPDRWAIAFGGKRPRHTQDPGGNPVTIHDMVLKARRLM
jgi:SAM-dependent methyltransferase